MRVVLIMGGRPCWFVEATSAAFPTTIPQPLLLPATSARSAMSRFVEVDD
jgi:hypothetical protein